MKDKPEKKERNVRGYKTKLRVNRKEIAYFKQCGRVRRTVFNWMRADYAADYRAYYASVQQAKDAGIEIPGMDIDKEQRGRAWDAFTEMAAEAGVQVLPFPHPNVRTLRKKKLNAFKRTEKRLAFLMEYPYCILQEAAEDFEDAVKKYREKKKSGVVSKIIAERKAADEKAKRNGQVGKWGRRMARQIERGYVGQELDPCFPPFKRRDDPVSFRLVGSIRVEESRVKLPSIGWVRLEESGYIPTDALKICSATISEHNDIWYISVTVEEELPVKPVLSDITLGVAVGAIDLIATSSGMIVENPKTMDKFARRRRRLGRELSRRTHRIVDEEGNVRVDRTRKNWRKTKAKIAKLDARVANIRSTSRHTATRRVVDTLPKTIVLKEMNVADILKKSRSAKYVMDAAIGTMNQQISYKAGWNGTEVVKSPVPVANLCSACGEKVTVNYRTKLMSCPSCGLSMRASLNVAMNLEEAGLAT